MTDDNGKDYIEGMSGLWCTALGFGNERLAEAAARQIRDLSFYHGFNQKSHAPQIELAERLLGLAPVPMSKVFFANSGSEANDTAFKLVWYRSNAIGTPEKKKIIGRVKGYHGVTIAAASATGTPINHQAFDLPIDRSCTLTVPTMLVAQNLVKAKSNIQRVWPKISTPLLSRKARTPLWPLLQNPSWALAGF